MTIVVEASGAVSALAPSWPETWDSLVRGEMAGSGAGTWASAHAAPAELAEVPSLERGPDCDGTASAARLAASAIREAAEGVAEPSRMRIYGGTTHGEYDIVQALLVLPAERQADGALGAWNRALVYDSIPEHLLAAQGLPASACSWVYSACTSSMHALALACMDHQLDDGEDTRSLIVGVDSLSRLEVCGFHTAGAVTKGVCSPFHQQRDGILIGEGAAALRLATAGPNEQAGAVAALGVGMSCDAGHAVEPDSEGIGIANAIGSALQRSGIRPEDVAAVVLHGTGTIKNDAAEANAMRRVFGERQLPSTTIKAALGHTMGAAGIFNCLVAVEACRRRLLPPACPRRGDLISGINLVLDDAMEIGRGAVVACSSGFGGNNCAAVFRELE